MQGRAGCREKRAAAMASSLIAVVQAACGSKWRCENAMTACLVAELALVGGLSTDCGAAAVSAELTSFAQISVEISSSGERRRVRTCGDVWLS